MAIPHATSDRLYRATNALAPFYRFFEFFEARNRDPASNNFAFGNPQEMTMKGFVTALQDWSTPQDKDWFAYKLSEESARETVAATLRAWRGASFEADDILMTNGGFAAIAVALNTVVSLGEEVIYVTPPWFFYEAMIYMTGARPVRVPIRADTFDLDLAAIEAALTERTRAIIVNSPNNPTGKIYPPETLQGWPTCCTGQRAAGPPGVPARTRRTAGSSLTTGPTTARRATIPTASCCTPTAKRC